MKKMAPLVLVIIFSINLVQSTSAATIDFDTISPNDAKYSLVIVDNIELDSLYGLVAGEIIDLSGLGAFFADTYYVSSVEHSINSEGYSAAFTLDRQEGALVDENGNTDINFMLLDYTVSTFDIQDINYNITSFKFTPVPESLGWLLFMTGILILMGILFFGYFDFDKRRKVTRLAVRERT